MHSALKVVIADDDRLVLQTLRRFLSNLGHEIVAEASTGQALIDAVNQHRPDMVVTDIRLEKMDGLTATEVFTHSHQVPVIVISCHNDQPMLERASVCPVQAFLPKPFNESILAAAIAIAKQRFAEMQLLQQEVQDARRRLADRAAVEKAKGLLMKRAAIDESTAYERLRSMARNSGQTTGEIARGLLLAADALQR